MLPVAQNHKELIMEKNWSKTDVGTLAALKRAELKDALGLSGCEVSLNTLPAGQAIPFVHKHKENEELYIVIAGEGEFWLDGETIPLTEGSCVKVLPAAGRAIRASKNKAITYACIQSASGSLRQYTRTDGVITEEKTGW